ncbi:MAG TPA: MarR family transcriptional regulator [Casimicrobiaceae bacterium]|nr:MarR family transcriptional regulator [Casimicrobiaceae bacterium]
MKANEPSIPYLIHRIAVRVEDSINKKARKYGLRIGEIRVLMRLLTYGPLNPGQLAHMTSIENSALSHLLRRLHERALVTRRRPSSDQRLVMVDLTARGRRIATVLQPHIRRYNDVAITGLSPRDIARLRDLLGRVYDNVVRLEHALPDFPELERASPSRARQAAARTGARAVREP